MFSLDCNLICLLEMTIYPLSMMRGNEVTLNYDEVAFLRDSGFVQQVTALDFYSAALCKNQ